ncbi:MAG: 3-oxoacid CoA-transferase [Oscillospiraceae bacterium]|nr:3-oxoacid CoA-transferase [Oscillospiraceae bacterium]
MKNKVMTAAQAALLIDDNATIGMGGFFCASLPEAVYGAVEERFLGTGHPRNLSLMWIGACGRRNHAGADHFAHEGMVRRAAGGHFGYVPEIAQMIIDEKIEGYNVPQGALVFMMRDSAAGRIGTFTSVGLGSFADPRNGGGRLNSITTEDICKVIEIDGQEQLFYPRIGIDAAIIRGTYADELGNVTMEKEMGPLDSTALAMAAHNNGGKVIVQVEKVVKPGSLDPKLVKIPGIYVDAIVVCPIDDPRSAQILGGEYEAAYSGNVQIPLAHLEPKPLDVKKIIGRRAAMELRKNVVVNLGIGIPEYVAAVASEEGIEQEMTLTVESGPVGGVPGSGVRFGGSINAQAFLDTSIQFDFYDGGGLDICFLGLGEADEAGNVNVSRFGKNLTGCGGFMSIAGNSKKVVFCSSFTSGLQIKTGDGKLEITEEGKKHKFVSKVREITFSGKIAAKQHRDILYITERAVFRLKEDGLHLVEVAPGIDIKTQILDEMDFEPIVDKNLKLMDERIFIDRPMGLIL